MTTWILLDVDGVLNAAQAGGSHPTMSKRLEEFVYGGGQYWPIRWNPKIVDALNDIGELPDVQFMWATTWRNYGNSGIRPALGLGKEGEEHDWPVLHPMLAERAQTTFPSIEWKIDAAREMAEPLYVNDVRTTPDTPFKPGDRIVHIDDEFYGIRAAEGDDTLRYLAWAQDNGHLVIGPDPTFGIRPEDIAAIREFVAAK